MAKGIAKEITGTVWRSILPVAIGLGVCAWLFHDDFNASTWNGLHFSWRTALGIILAMFFVAGRDFGLTWRFHTIAGNDLPWHRALKVDIMCAFTSAITPSVVGGSALAIFYLNREGIKLGRATTLTLTTLFLDEMFFVVFCPVIVLTLPSSALFGSTSADSLFMDSVEIVFWLVYTGIVIWTSILYLAIIARPKAMQRLLHRIASTRLLRRWSDAINSTADNMVSTSEWVRGRSARWWLNVFGATTVSWFSRYLIVNALFWGFVPDASGFLVFGRQFVVWVVLMISPTPGGSGISEWLFTGYYGDLIGSAGIALVLAMIWRILSYYLYLVLGFILLPGYFRSTRSNASRQQIQNSETN